jgi:uncharacterized protein (DUF885 family)
VLLCSPAADLRCCLFALPQKNHDWISRGCFLEDLVVFSRNCACLVVSTVLAVSSSCSQRETADPQFEQLSKQYVEDLLKLNPEFATSLGEHRYDAQLDDYSLDGVQRNLQLEKDYLQKLSAIDPATLGEVNGIDYEVLRSQIEGSIFSLEVLREYEWNPMRYNVGGAIYGLLAREFAPLPERLHSVKERLKGVPAALEAAKTNLQNPPKMHTETAILQNQGTISLIRDELNQFLEQAPELKQEIAPVQQAAIEALEAYGKWLQSDLLPRSNGDFRLGLEKFRAKLTHTIDSDLTMEQILERAQQRLAETQQAMYDTALPLFAGYFPNAPAAQREDHKHVIKAVLDKLAENRPDDQKIVDQARQNLQETTDFVRDQQLVSLPAEPVAVIVMPEFQRGISVAYCDSPGPLEKNGETFYAISPTPADWSKERVQSFYREYNGYMLKDLTMHEAMPGHYLQLAHSNKFQAPTMIRAIFYSGPFVEGWATYAEQIMVEHGFGGPEVKMQQLKMLTRAILNAILDQKIHTAGMTEQEAMDLMKNEGFQEEGEAAGKWRRACLTSTQLSSYFVGNTEVNDIRKAYEAKHGAITDWRTFHDQMLSYGSPPAKYIKRMMGL